MVTSNLQPITLVIAKLNMEYPRPRQSVQAQDGWKKLGWWEEYDMRVGASGRTRRSINKLIAQIQIRRLNSILVEDTTGLGVCVGPLTSLWRLDSMFYTSHLSFFGVSAQLWISGIPNVIDDVRSW